MWKACVQAATTTNLSYLALPDHKVWHTFVKAGRRSVDPLHCHVCRNATFSDTKTLFCQANQ